MLMLMLYAMHGFQYCCGGCALIGRPFPAAHHVKQAFVKGLTTIASRLHVTDCRAAKHQCLQYMFTHQLGARDSDFVPYCSGRFTEVVDCGHGEHIARGTTAAKQTSRRWAAMRLLQELHHTIDPAFFRDTPQGVCSLQSQGCSSRSTVKH